jgi:hypothetical protein
MAALTAHEGQHGIDQREGLPQRGLGKYDRRGDSRVYHWAGVCKRGIEFQICLRHLGPQLAC